MPRGFPAPRPYLIGEALGIYGLTQGLLQIPFGLLSDKVGRKTMIVFGLLVFAAGSAVAALSTSIGGVIVGRALQGAGAVGSVILALVADLTAEENRTKAMAMVGITIGASFMVALVAGPILASFIGVAGIFWLMVALAAIGVAITQFVVPSPRRLTVHRDAETVPALMLSVLGNAELLRLDFGIFALHAMLTASFLVVPGLLRATLDISNHNDWLVYLPVLIISIAVMVPAIIVAEKYRRMKGVFVAAVAGLAVSQALLHFGGHNLYVLLAALTIFFAAFNVMEASLPSLITKTAPPAAKGTATGHLFERAVPRHLRRRHRRRLCQPARRQRRRVHADGTAGACLACRRRHHGAAELPHHAAGADRRRPRRRRRRSRRPAAPGAGRRRGCRHRRGKARLPESGFESLRRRHGARARRRALITTMRRGSPALRGRQLIRFTGLPDTGFLSSPA